MANIDPSGSFGAPPPGAPQEVTQELKPELVAEQIAKARANERSLPPLVFTGGPPLAGALPTPSASESQGLNTPAPKAPTPPPSGIVLTDAPQTLAEAAAYRTGAALIGGHAPAASDTDSPSRGIPKPIADPGKVITGGFGHAMEAQYFPLTGAELKELARSLLDQLNGQIENDLHFMEAICYPRISVVLRLEVRGYTQDEGFTIQKGVAHEKTPEDVAQLAGSPMEFALEAVRNEFNDEGEAIDPPDRIRDSLGLVKPHKQQIDTAGGKMIVDLPSLGGSF